MSSTTLPSNGLPPLRAVQVFESVARTGSVQDAAAELGVSPGAVSQQIHKLETLLELKLFERRGKGLELSTWGRLYLEQLGSVFEQLRVAHQTLRNARSDRSLVVSCLSSVASKWLGPRLFDWQAGHPDARMRLLGAENEPRLDQGEADFRLSYGRQARQHAHYTELFTDWVVPACAPGLLKRRPLNHPSQLLGLPRIGIAWEHQHLPAPDWIDWARSVGAELQTPSASLTFSLSSAAIDAAIAGHGVVLAQVAMIESDLREGRLVLPFDHRLPLPEPYVLAWDAAALAQSQGRAFYQWIRAQSRQQGLRSSGQRPLQQGPVTAR